RIRVHYPPGSQSELILSDVMRRAEALGDAVRSGRTPRADALSEFADIAYGYHQAMPFQRGSDGISQAYLRGLYSSITGEALPHVPLMDVHAQTMSQAEFSEWLRPRLEGGATTSPQGARVPGASPTSQVRPGVPEASPTSQVRPGHPATPSSAVDGAGPAALGEAGAS